MKFRTLTACVAILAGLTAGPASGHFLWLAPVPAERPTEVRVYFSERAAPDDPGLLDNVARAQIWTAGSRRAEPKALELIKTDDALTAAIPADAASSAVVANLTYGVLSRGGETFLLKYYAKSYPSQLPGTWLAVNDKQLLPLEIVPTLDGATAVLEVRWQGEPAAGATLTVDGPGLESRFEGSADEKGVIRCQLVEAGLYSIRARHIERTAGEHEGKQYDSIRHYSTLAMPYTPAAIASVADEWPKLPRGVTSFGAAVDGDWLYVYGGHYGEAHHYSQQGQSGDFLRLNLRGAGEWETLSGGPKLTGLGMAAHAGMIYRVGGFTANNVDDEKESLWSQPDFAAYDPQTQSWLELPALDQGRSSHDAAVVGDTLYVVGGWKLQGEAPTEWHETAWSVDLSAAELQWKPIAAPPFQRRALALAAWRDKLYVLGGMQQEGATTTRVAVYDPATDAWSEGPSLLGPAMDGFGCAAFACDGQLFATTMSGAIQRLSADGARWELAGHLEHARFFHRILPRQDRELVVVGGAHMAVGKIDGLERLPIAASANAQP